MNGSPFTYRLFGLSGSWGAPDWVCGATALDGGSAPEDDDPDIGIPGFVPLFDVGPSIADLEADVLSLHYLDIGWVGFSIWHQSRYGTRRRVAEGIKAAAAELHFIGSIGGVTDETEEAFGPLAVQKVKNHMVLDSWWVEATFHPF